MELNQVFLKPGEIHIDHKPVVVRTILGSCVAVTLICRRLGIGAICHALLPFCAGREDGFRYVDYSIYWMLHEFSRYGARLREIEVKLFGGSDMLVCGGYDSGPKQPTIGQQNIRAALEIIEREGLNLLSSDVGGFLGRKILFNLHTGEVLVSRQKRVWPGE